MVIECNFICCGGCVQIKNDYDYVYFFFGQLVLGIDDTFVRYLINTLRLWQTRTVIDLAYTLLSASLSQIHPGC